MHPQGKLVLFEKNRINSGEEFIPAYKETLKEAIIIGNKVVCVYLKDIDYVSITFDTAGTPIKEIDFPTGTSAHGFEKYNDSITVFCHTSFLNPPVVYKYNVNSGDLELEKTN